MQKMCRQPASAVGIHPIRRQLDADLASSRPRIGAVNDASAAGQPLPDAMGGSPLMARCHELPHHPYTAHTPVGMGLESSARLGWSGIHEAERCQLSDRISRRCSVSARSRSSARPRILIRSSK